MSLRCALGLVLGLGLFGLVPRSRVSAASPCAAVANGSTQARLVYIKSDHVLCLLEGSAVVWERAASHGRKAGKKRWEGDDRTPEGKYTVKPARPSKRFGMFMAISYPNADDIRSARAEGRKPGGGIGIHGPQSWYAFLGKAHALADHSDGCIVLDARGMEELARRVVRRLSIEILASLPER